jgi:Cd2+/Zn2+-exporting ATPase
MVVACDGHAIGVVAVADRIRPDAAEMVRRLHAAGVKKVVMLTGDIEPVARAVGEAVGIDEVRAGLLPEDKLEAVEALRAEGYTVAMVGDGVNDAPALATADIGVAMGAAGTGVAIETADIALMKDNLLKLPEAVSLAKRTVSNMRQNIVIALATVAVLMLGVLLGGVTMSVGMLVHEASVLVVIINAMRLMRPSSSMAEYVDLSEDLHTHVDLAIASAGPASASRSRTA